MGIATTVIVFTLVTALTLLLFRRTGISAMGLGEFCRRLLRGWRTPAVGPDRLLAMRRTLGDRLLLIDLRPAERFASGQIPGAISRPFDDFLRELVVDGRYDGDRQRPIVLVCDTGHMSRVAADILLKDEGFSRVYNLRGGMGSWHRWSDRRLCWCRRLLAG